MGHGIAELFAMSGYDVSLTDKFPEVLEKAKGRITASLTKLAERGKMTGEQADSAFRRIAFVGDIPSAVKGSDLVIEAVPEVLELKKSLLKEVAAAAPGEAIVASNTSNIRISELAEGMPRPDRVVGMHFFNPPVLMKLVEITPGRDTDPAVLDELAAVCTKLGRTPIRVLKDSPGFIVDRINAADGLFLCLIQDKGVATPDEVDQYARSQGLPMGMYELMDFVGVDIGAASLSYFSKALSPEYGKGKTYAAMVQAGHLGKKTGRGFYDWSSGKPQIANVPPTDKVSVMDIFTIEINESVKLIEEGIARPDDIEKAVVLGMGRPFGPISVAKGLSNSEVKSKLEELSQKYDCKVFAPTKSIQEGKMLDAIEGRLGELAPPPSASTAAERAQAEGQSVLVEKLPGGVARVVINRPKLNLLNAEALDELEKAFSGLAKDREVRVVILTGKGGVFSAGADLSQYIDSSVAFMDIARKGERLFKTLTEFPKLTIAVVKGYALGGGLELSMACDIRIATEDCQLGLPEVTRGILPGWTGSQKLTRLVGLTRAATLVLTAERMDGKRAFEIGLVSRLAPKGDPDEYALQYGRELAATVAPVAVMLAKRLLYKGAEVPSDVGLEMESMAYGVLFGTQDLKEGMSAFLGKRKPEFKGK
jgi:enoyl-CoA hydratase/3-hydroxyacyl-CoA dehydrogenase